MKKSFVFFLALALVAFFTVPAAAEWNFYGSARMKTFFEDVEFAQGTVNGAGDDDDVDLDWSQQANSRFGAKVKGDAVTGRLEVGIRGEGGDLYNRLIYGQWDFGPGKILVGQDYTPISMFYSGQVYAQDNGLLGIGAAYGGRHGQIKLQFGSFDIALIDPNQGTSPLGGDLDVLSPKFEASYKFATDMFNVKVAAGYQTYSDDDGVNDIDIDSYIFAAAGGFTPGMFYVNGGGYFGKNMGSAGWAGGGNPALNAAGSDVDDSDTWGAFGVVGVKPSDTISIEAGYGYNGTELDQQGQETDDTQSYYVQAVVVLAPGMYIIPEIGVIDNMDNAAGNDEGKTTYYGAKWQIDF